MQLLLNFIVVNDGGEIEQLSNLFDVVRDSHPSIKFISYNENMGKGFALRTGVVAASAPYIITTDLDFPYHVEDLKKVFLLLKAGEDIVVGRRNRTYYASIPFRRKVISKACNALNRYLLKLPIVDAQSGLKGFPMQSIHSLAGPLPFQVAHKHAIHATAQAKAYRA